MTLSSPPHHNMMWLLLLLNFMALKKLSYFTSSNIFSYFFKKVNILAFHKMLKWQRVKLGILNEYTSSSPFWQQKPSQCFKKKCKFEKCKWCYPNMQPYVHNTHIFKKKIVKIPITELYLKMVRSYFLYLFQKRW